MSNDGTSSEASPQGSGDGSDDLEVADRFDDFFDSRWADGEDVDVLFSCAASELQEDRSRSPHRTAPCILSLPGQDGVPVAPRSELHRRQISGAAGPVRSFDWNVSSSETSSSESESSSTLSSVSLARHDDDNDEADVAEERDAEVVEVLAVSVVRKDTIPSVGPLSWLPSRPSPVLPGISWWFEVLWDILMPLRARLPREASCVYRTEHPCAGSHPDGLSYKALGIPHECLGVADKNKMSRKFILHTFDKEAGRIFTDNQAFIDGVGTCDLAGSNTAVAREEPHSVSCGFPCQPWSSGVAQKRKKHPLYMVTMAQFPLYLKVRRPHQFWLENLVELAQEPKHGEPSDLETLAAECCKLGYAVRAVTIEHEMFAEVPRTRTA